MEKDFRRVCGTRGLVLVFVFLAVVISFPPCSYGEEEVKTKWGFSFLSGFYQKSDNGLKMFAFLPRIGLPLHPKWDLEFEGNFSYYGIKESKNLYLMGVNTNILFRPIQWEEGHLFLIGGVGMAYDNNNGRIRDIGDSHVAGILQIGSGIEYYLGKGCWIRGEYRFHHISDPFEQDSGINTHHLILGLSF